MEATLTFLGSGTFDGRPHTGLQLRHVCADAVIPGSLNRRTRGRRCASSMEGIRFLSIPAPTSMRRPSARTSAASTPCSTPTATPTTFSAWTTSVPSSFGKPDGMPLLYADDLPLRTSSSVSSNTPFARSTATPPAPAIVLNPHRRNSRCCHRIVWRWNFSASPSPTDAKTISPATASARPPTFTDMT